MKIDNLSFLILTFNEEIHIKRCITDLLSFVPNTNIYVIDSYSDDTTIQICNNFNVVVYQNTFINHSSQINWAINTIKFNTDWIMRVDADELLSNNLKLGIKKAISVNGNFNGFLIKRVISFKGKILKFGGISHWVLRLWRNNMAVADGRLMDEHMLLLSGKSGYIKGTLIDENLNGIGWWINKHNTYSSKEAIEILNGKYNIYASNNTIHQLDNVNFLKHWLKDNIYNKMLPQFRSFLYFLYRMFFLLGFLDGSSGLLFHFLQGFWYRLIVDTKVLEVENRMKVDRISCREAIDIELNGSKFL